MLVGYGCVPYPIFHNIREIFMKKKNKWTTFILLLVFFIGLSVMLYPALSSYWNSKTQSKAIVDYEKMLQNMAQKDYTAFFEDADEYNKELASLEIPLLQFDEVEGYFDILDITGTGIMGYITIDKIGVELPIYHGTSDDVLAAAAGHLQGTSFPVGGENTHAVISAHRGLPTATLFTHLDRMEVGDIFEIKVLDRVMIYQVDRITIVKPEDASGLRIEEGKDYFTLLTCTPYGINSHRLLVRGVQLDTVQEKKLYVVSDAHQIDPLIVTPAVALPMLFVLMIIVLLKPVKKDDLGDEL